MSSELIFKNYVFTKSDIDVDDRTIISTISTDSVDRDLEVVLPKGLELGPYEQSRIVLWAHDMKAKPIGKNLWITASDHELIAKTQFAETPAGEELWKLYKGDFLKSWSVGFIPDRANMSGPTSEELKTRPDWKTARNVIRKGELLEYSAVSIGCNRDALKRAYRTKSVEVRDISNDLLRELIGPEFEPHGYTKYAVLMTEKDAKRQAERELAELTAEELRSEWKLDDLVKEVVSEAFHVAKGGV